MPRTRTPPPKPPKDEARRPRKNFVREWRKYRDMTLEELSAASGVSVSGISNIETGKHGYTSATLENLADALSCSPADLLDKKPGLDDEMIKLWKELSERDRERWLRSLRAFRDEPA